MAKLGKGLGAIFGQDFDENIIKEKAINAEPNNININTIKVNPYQPRTVFDEKALQELADSIKEHGVIQPLIVRKALSGFELIAGERRLRASKIANLKTVPCVIVEMKDDEMMEVALLENIQRQDLTIIEESRGYKNIIEKLNYTQEELALKLGKSRSHITNCLRLLKLPTKVIEMLEDNSLSMGHARALITIEDEDKIIKLAQIAKDKNLNVREMEKLAKSKKVNVEPKEIDPFLKNVSNIMQNKLQTSVKLDKHNITIKYNGNDDLNRILEIINCLED